MAHRLGLKLATAAFAALAAGSTAMAAPAAAGPNGDEGVAALRQVLTDPYGPTPDVLKSFSFSQSQYLVDGLTVTEQRKLSKLVYVSGVHLPVGIDTAIRAKAPRNINNP